MDKLHVTDNHMLAGNDVTQLSCPKNTRPFQKGLPDTIVLHYTAGRSGEGSARYLARKNVNASAHLVIDRSGEIFQLVAFNLIAWHAGSSQHKGRTGMNKYAIGIEIDNAGILSPAGDQFVSWFGKKYPAEDVIQATHRNENQPAYWHLYTEKQIELVEEICELLMERYPIKYILGHEEIAPGRKQDPGPAFPLDEIRQRLFNDRDQDEPVKNTKTGIVKVPYLRVRNAPWIMAFTTGLLRKGDKVEIFERQNDFVRIGKDAFVVEKFLDIV